MINDCSLSGMWYCQRGDNSEPTWRLSSWSATTTASSSPTATTATCPTCLGRWWRLQWRQRSLTGLLTSFPAPPQETLQWWPASPSAAGRPTRPGSCRSARWTPTPRSWTTPARAPPAPWAPGREDDVYAIWGVEVLVSTLVQSLKIARYTDKLPL